MSIEDVADVLGHLMHRMRHQDDIHTYGMEMLAYLLDKDYKIEAEWVAKLIDDDELIERIKKKHTFTLMEIYEARDDIRVKNKYFQEIFYGQVYKHFPDPDYADPFAMKISNVYKPNMFMIIYKNVIFMTKRKMNCRLSLGMVKRNVRLRWEAVPR